MPRGATLIRRPAASFVSVTPDAPQVDGRGRFGAGLGSVLQPVVQCGTFTPYPLSGPGKRWAYCSPSKPVV